MNWITKLRGKAVEQLERPVEENPVDKIIVDKGQSPQVNEVYQARWVWYHTILAAEIACTNILLVLILFVLAFK